MKLKKLLLENKIIVFAGSLVQKKHERITLISSRNSVLQPDSNINGIIVTVHWTQNC